MTDAAPSGDSCCYEYLTEISPSDKPWDTNKLLSGKVGRLYHDSIYHRLAERMGDCGKTLEFGWVNHPEEGKSNIRLKSAHFCRVRHCIICQWRRSLMWTARFLKAMPLILREYPSARFIFLTLTVANCPVGELRSTLDHMNAAWKRMIQRKSFPAIGFARSTEVTKGKDGSAHPHFHALLMVPSTYFNGAYYMTQENWTELWRSCLRVDYTPIVNVKAVKPNKRWQAEAKGELMPAEQLLAGAIVETFKYTVKPSDLIGEETETDRQWLLHLTSQLDRTRAIALGGVFKNYLSENEPEDLVGKTNEDEVSLNSIYFGWELVIRRYLKLWEET